MAQATPVIHVHRAGDFSLILERFIQLFLSEVDMLVLGSSPTRSGVKRHERLAALNKQSRDLRR